ncbi:rho-N domain-containing protein 1, chloroplastic [Cornus florida]|uniref:rho-N domain-containing protein 1, chloroplastic n=1 Tax=Cornus florida TaxID=4283 RepID=UPI0028A08C27|nr:rho-N domain-containing protein 1, chloroplastic [Cornus florida]
MDAVIFYPRSILRLPSFSGLNKRNLGNPIFSLKEIADRPSLFASQKESIQLTVSSIRADGNRRGQPPRKYTTTGRTTRGDDNKIPRSSNGKSSNSSNQEEIIALFRRIQSSISNGESLSAKKKSSLSSEDKPSAESVLEVLRQSRKQVKDKVLSGRRDLLEKERNMEDDPSIADLKLTRPPSKFVKRSPVPSSSTPKGKVVEMKTEASSATAGYKELELQKVEEMKLPALKKLAKSRGIKGYSKLKKSELVELLRS